MDAAALQAFVSGDQAAFEALFREHQREVYAWIVRLVRDPAAAEDLTLETFWRIYRSRARFDPSRSFGAWARASRSTSRSITSIAPLRIARASRRSRMPTEQPAARARRRLERRPRPPIATPAARSCARSSICRRRCE
jgi:RNA polymerase sigma factor (sigma-70 family)